MDKPFKKELLLYSIIAIIVIVISILNNVFWKVGKDEKEVPKNEIQYLEQDNITYNVPFEEQWLD